MKKLKEDYCQRNFYDDIRITDHAKKRFIQRSNKTIDGIYRGDFYRVIISMVKKSKLINSVKHKDNQMYEYRECSGYIFVCLITFSKNFWEKDINEIITIMLSKRRIEEMLKMGYNKRSMAIKDLALLNEVKNMTNKFYVK